VSDQTTTDLVPRLRYVPEYLDPDAHDRLLAAIDAESWHAFGDERRIQFYGYWYNHAKGGLYRVGELPRWASELAARLVNDGLMPYVTDQLIVSEYTPGQGIRPHVDAPLFAGVIANVSLGSTCIMEFTHAGGTRQQVPLEPRSALVLSGPARETWQHSIPARHADDWRGRTVSRSRRVSLTFRKMLVTKEA
jgi:alkylated DNA repair dioxygenase AlkB